MIPVCEIPWHQLKRQFPHLRKTKFQQQSPGADRYNCMALAVGIDQMWWWPSGDYWPPCAPRENTEAAFVAVFEALGYRRCKSAEPISQHEKVAVYTTGNSVKHVTRQLQNGRWCSKLGAYQAIIHEDVDALRGRLYGNVSAFLVRRINHKRHLRRLKVVMEDLELSGRVATLPDGLVRFPEGITPKC
jgi:hypothetical protein